MIGTRVRSGQDPAASGGPATHPTPHPRIRERRDAVVRARGRRRLRILTALVVVAALVIVGTALLYLSGLFTARHVSVTGALHTPAPAVIAAAGVGGAPPLVEVDTGTVAADVDRLPWVARTTVSRRWPDSLAIAVVERTPVAVVADGHEQALVDRTGRVLALESLAPAGLPTLSAPVAVGAPGSWLGAAARPGLVVAAAVPPALVDRIGGVAVRADRTVTLDLGHGVEVEMGPATSLEGKFEALASLLAGAPPTGPELIDLTVPDEPTVAPPPAPAPVPAGPTP